LSSAAHVRLVQIKAMAVRANKNFMVRGVLDFI
jgi:hypothetical protein